MNQLSAEQLIEYKSHLDKDLLDFANMIIKRLKLDWDIVIAITGEEGSGKSSLAIWLGFLIQRLFNLEKNIAYLPSSKQIKQKFNTLPPFSVFVVDEAVKGLHKYKWFDEVQQTVIELYATERFQNKCSLMLMPRFRDFTENFRNHRIKVWIHIINRNSKEGKAIAVAYLRDDDKDAKDPWHFDENIKMKKKKFSRKSIVSRTVVEKLSYEKKTLNYLFDFEFPKLPKDIEKQYTLLKMASRKEIDEAEEPEKKRIDLWKNSVRKAIKMYKRENKDVTQAELGKVFGLAQKTVSNLLKERK